MNKLIYTLICLAMACAGMWACKPSASQSADKTIADSSIIVADTLQVGAARTELYLPLLNGKKVALFSNHTGLVQPGKHTLDALIENDIDVKCVFAPEHGFRGTADAGASVSSSIDSKTGVPIVSLYGKGHSKAMNEALADVDAIVVDIQDVGLRYYTYYVTMLELMEAAAQRNIEFVVLDRPNPNGMYVDGPILDMKYKSGVGKLPIPIVHGLTLGEMAQMANGEGWLKEGSQARLTVVPVKNYTHQTRYELPVAPSPNLPNMTAVYLYPSLCYFEGTNVSLGRGTDKPFQIYGHPRMKNRSFSFVPESRAGATNPPQKGIRCYGEDLSGMESEAIISRGIDLSYLIDAYEDIGEGDKFFTSFFELLIGRGDIRDMIKQGKSAEEIKATWQKDVEAFKDRRRPYLIYDE